MSHLIHGAEFTRHGPCLPVRFHWSLVLACLALVLVAPVESLHSQPSAPNYEECRLDSIFPNGGQRGTKVKVEFRGFGTGLTGPKEIVIDGPPGISVSDIKSMNPNTVEAVLDIAADAPLGRRWLRVLSERSGLTNFAYFVVGGLPERLEVEPNNDLVKAQLVTMPLVVTGQVNPQADLDVFKIQGKAGQKLVAAVGAHALDIHGQYKDYGIADFSLELLDANGRTLAAAEDTLGFDPMIEQTLPGDGDYYVRIQLLNYGGFREAVYRLTLGEVPYPVGVFPPGYQRGTQPKLELFGPNVPPAQLVQVDPLGTQMPSDSPLRHVGLLDPSFGGIDLPVVEGDLPESLESEPNDELASAVELKRPVVVNGRFQRPNDADWYRIQLEAQQKIWVEIIAQRFIRSPVDTLVQIYDAKGTMLAENDDEVFEPGYESYHDFKTTDSKLMFTAPASGEFFVKVTEQSGLHGPRLVYRLSVQDAKPDFRLSHFPDAAPVWGPGSTACILVRVDRFAGFDEDVEVSIEGLPGGWASRSAVSLGGKGVRPYNTYQLKVFVTVTAPQDAVPGTPVPIRIVGRAPAPKDSMISGTVISGAMERVSLPMTLFYTSDTGFFRLSPQARVAVAKSQGPWLELAGTSEITIAQGGSGSVPVKVRGAGDLKQMPIAVNVAMAGVACGLVTPQNLPIQPAGDQSGIVNVPIQVAPEIPPGTYYITVAQTWRGDIRIGMPGPCTPLIKLHVVPKQ